MGFFLLLPWHHIPSGLAKRCKCFCINQRLKWKPSEENTVDFKVSVYRQEEGLKYHISILVDGSDYKDFGEITLEDEVKAEWDSDPPNGRIIECRYDSEWPNTWRFSRYRDDKLDANHISTFEKIMESIKDNVTEDEVRRLC
jgi:mRNA guanylyltransferase